MNIADMRFIKHSIFCLIIFSNTSFGKEFNELFTIYEAIEDPSKIEKTINNSFNTMIYRLSGDPSPSNIWKIINAGNVRKDFIKSYSIKNINDQSFLQVDFDKDLLVKKFNELSIPALGNSRPVVLFLINIDSGSKKPYLLKDSESNSEIDSLIKQSLKDFASSRGIFLELPEPDLQEINSLDNYSKLINSNSFISSQHSSTEVVEINITKIGLKDWSVNGDINFIYNEDEFNMVFLQEFNKFINQIVNKILKKNLIDISKESLINISVANINNYDDYKKSREVIQRLVATKDIEISKFELNKISYQINIYGDFKSYINEMNENNFIEINNILYDSNTMNLNFKR